ncbi:MAG: YfhO family protein [SAR324 cluster bacterium]|nr:YfhO family protein [SAR324 cluster bacterium]
MKLSRIIGFKNSISSNIDQVIGWLSRGDLKLFIVFLLFLIISYPSEVFFVTKEPAEDFIRYFFSIDQLTHLHIPLWNPFVGNGQPFYYYLLLNSFPSPLDWMWVLIVKILKLTENISLLDSGFQFKYVFGTLFSLAIYKIGRLLVICDSVQVPHKLDFIAPFTVGLLTVQFIWELRFGGGDYVFCVILIPSLFMIYYSWKFYWLNTSYYIFLKFCLSSILLLHYSGCYSVPLGFAMITIWFFQLILPNSASFFPKLRNRVLNLGNKNIVRILIIAFFTLVSITPFLEVFLTEFASMIRISRNIEQLGWMDLVNSQGGQSFNKYSNFLQFQQGRIGTQLLLIYFGIISLFQVQRWSRLFPVLIGLITIASVFLGERSWFLIIFYRELFPVFQKALYTGVYYDFVVIFVLVLSGYGIRCFFSGTWPLVHSIGYGLFAILLFCTPWNSINSTYIILLILTLLIILRRFIINFQRFGVILCIFIIAFNIHYQRGMALNQQSDLSTELQKYREIEWGQPIIFPEFRTKRLKQSFEQWGNGFPLLEKEFVYDPEPNFMLMKKQYDLIQTLNPQQKDRVFGVSKPMIRFSPHYKIVNHDDALKTTGNSEELDVVSSTEKLSELGETMVDKNCMTNALIQIKEFQVNSLSMNTHTSCQQLLVWSDSYHPGWKAYIDDQETEVLVANYGFKGLRVPTGDHSVEFVFKPRVKYLLIVENIIFWMGVVIVIYVNSRRKSGVVNLT